jgi:transcriptional regulator with PAS, ATPase and Fis domain
VVTLGGTSLRVEIGAEPVHVRLSDRERFGDVVGTSVEMRRVFAVMEKVAATESTVLIQGETGTGKEIVARAIHDASSRAAGPFVVVDCGAIAENLIESELFGHARGSFSGAVSDRKGLFAEASGGTIFLDEIGELPLPMQPKLLRALESRHIRRVGENTPHLIDVRVLAATNRPLASSVNDGSFREDLYYRLAVVEIQLPALRSRREDIPALARTFHERMTGGGEHLSEEFIASLVARSWPGNVRELRNCIERLVCLGAARVAPPALRSTSALPLGLETLVPVNLPFKDARAAWMEQFEMVYVTALLRKTGGNVTRAAEMAGLHRRSLQRVLASLGMRASDDDT